MRIRLKALTVAFSLMFAATAIAAPPTSRDATIHKYTRIAERDLSGMEIVTMADIETVWQSAGSGDFNVAANWTNGVPGAAASKVAVFDGTSNVALAINLDQSGAANSFKVNTTRNYFGAIGSPGNPLIIPPGFPVGTFRARVDHYIKIDGETVGGDIIIDVGSGFLELSSNVAASGGVLNRVMAKSGNILISSACTLTVLFIEDAASVTIEPVTGTHIGPSIVSVNGGTYNDARGIDSSWDVSGAHLVMYSGEINETGLLAGVPKIHLGAGRFRYHPLLDPASETPSFYISEGWLDASESAFPIVVATLIKGSRGKVSGGIVQKSVDLFNYDLSEIWP